MSPPAAAPAAGPGFSPARRDLLPCGARRPQVVEGTLSALIGLARRGCSGGSALSRGAPERVFALPGATAAPLRVRGPAAAAAATVRRALERARPAHRARAQAHICPPLSLPATHSSPAGAGRCGRRLRASPRERGPSPASCCRHRRARRRGHAAVASRRVCGREGSGERGGRPHTSSCAHM